VIDFRPLRVAILECSMFAVGSPERRTSGGVRRDDFALLATKYGEANHRSDCVPRPFA
jgi:hypothetical protein